MPNLFPPTDPRRPLRALELFCGIGGFAAAVQTLPVQVVAAFDQSNTALAVYRHNFPQHPAHQVDLERVEAGALAACEADLWWLSPPCQPYSVRGRQRDLDDPRAASLKRLLEILRELPATSLPAHLALENVVGFSTSRARRELLRILQGRGYRLQECRLCPTQLGIPSRRPRYYLTASRGRMASRPPPAPPVAVPLGDYLDPAAGGNPELRLSPEVVTRFGAGFRLLRPDAPTGYTTCFTSGYGRSLMHAGSYLVEEGRVRRFSPAEIARLLHFPRQFRFPEQISLAKRWQLLGNSLSVAAVREVLRGFPVLDSPAG